MIPAPGSGKMWIYMTKETGIMIGAPNSLNLNCKVRVMKEAPGPLVSEEIADIFTNCNIDWSDSVVLVAADTKAPLAPGPSNLQPQHWPNNHCTQPVLHIHKHTYTHTKDSFSCLNENTLGIKT